MINPVRPKNRSLFNLVVFTSVFTLFVQAGVANASACNEADQTLVQAFQKRFKNVRIESSGLSAMAVDPELLKKMGVGVAVAGIVGATAVTVAEESAFQKGKKALSQTLGKWGRRLTVGATLGTLAAVGGYLWDAKEVSASVVPTEYRKNLALAASLPEEQVCRYVSADKSYRKQLQKALEASQTQEQRYVSREREKDSFVSRLSVGDRARLRVAGARARGGR